MNTEFNIVICDSSFDIVLKDSEVVSIGHNPVAPDEGFKTFEPTNMEDALLIIQNCVMEDQESAIGFMGYHDYTIPVMADPVSLKEIEEEFKEEVSLQKWVAEHYDYPELDNVT